MNRRKKKLPKNVVTQDGRLYFNKVFRGQRYNAAFGLIDTPTNRKKAKIWAQQIVGVMTLGEFNSNDFEILSKYHQVEQDRRYPLFNEYKDVWLVAKRLLAEPSFRKLTNWRDA